MSAHFKTTEHVDPRDPTLPKKFYAQIINGDDMTLDELADLISKVSNLNYSEELCTLGTLIEIIEMQLRHCQQVRLSTLGTFCLALKSEAKDAKEELTTDQISGARIRFRAVKQLKKMMKIPDCEKASVTNENGQVAQAPGVRNLMTLHPVNDARKT